MGQQPPTCSRSSRPSWRWIALLAIVLLPCPSTRAHSVNIDAVAEDGALVIEAYYGDGKPVSAATVRVRSQAGPLLDGTTDAQGRFRFQPSRPEPLTIEVLQAGHKGTVTVEPQLWQTPSGASASQVISAGPAPSAASTPVVAERPRAGRNRVVPAIAGIALILAAASLWRVRTLSQQVDDLRRRMENPPR